MWYARSEYRRLNGYMIMILGGGTGNGRQIRRDNIISDGLAFLGLRPNFE